MAERTRLDERLAHGRAELLDAIDQPSLAVVDARARTLRRRRRIVRSGAAVALVAVGLLVTRPWGGAPPPRPADTPPRTPTVSVWTGAGITVNGLEKLVAEVPDLPGTVVDAQFTDENHGYVLATACRSDACTMSFARTTDGGRTWTRAELPASAAAPRVSDRPEVVPFDGGGLLLTGLAQDYTSADSGAHWRPAAPRSATASQRAAGPDEVLRMIPGAPAGAAIGVWSADGLRGPLATQPGLSPDWVAVAPTGTGQWWVGGRTASLLPAVAVSTDRGRTWDTTVLPGGANGLAGVQVSAVGSHVYAAALGPARELLGVFHSADRGATFTRTGPTGPAPRVAGELVPLLDGRLLTTTPTHEWWVSPDDGRTFTRAGGDLPSVGPLARTAAGYVAYQLFSGDAGWLALSTDGSTWRKLQIR